MIVVLDDMQERIEVLRNQIAPLSPVSWATTVFGLCEKLRRHRPSLVILDHDLGPGSTSHEDCFGHTGFHAACFAPIPRGTPVLVRSCNGEGWAPKMVEVLRSRGLRAEAHRFGTEDAKTFIRKHIRR